MTKAKPALFLILLVAGLVFLQSFHFQAQGQASVPSVRFDPAQVQGLSVGDNFTVYVWVDNASGIEGAQVQFTYDLTVLNCTDVVEGPFLESVGPTAVAEEYSAPISLTVGEVYYASAGMSGQVVSGSGILLNVSFTVLSEGSAQFHLIPYSSSSGNEAGTYFLDINYHDIIPNLTDGFYGSPVSLIASQTLMHIGDSATLSGTVSGSLSGNITSVELVYAPLGGKWTDLGSVKTNSSGYFSYPWTATENGVFEFQVSFSFEEKTTNSDIIEVTVIQPLRGFGIYVLYAFVALLALIIVASVVLRVRSNRKKAADKPTL